MRRIAVWTGLVSMMLVAGLVGCASKAPSSAPSQPSQASGKIVVFAAASLKPAFTQLSQRFNGEKSGQQCRFRIRGLFGARDPADAGRDR